MTEKQKRISIILLITLAVIATSISVSYFLIIPAELEGELSVYLHLYSSPAREELAQLITDFERTYPLVKITTIIEPYLDLRKSLDQSSELVLTNNQAKISSLLASHIPEETLVSPGSWTGTEWKLYYNEETLKGQGFSLEDLQNLETLNMTDFLSSVDKIRIEGQTIFSVSTRYYIQWLSWIQHFALTSQNGEMPPSYAIEDWRDTIIQFNSFVDRGIFNHDHNSINEASTILRMFRGESLFVLAKDDIYSLFLPGDREKVKSLPFPGSRQQAWFVGSGFYLTLEFGEQSKRGTKAAARTFLEYLRSDKVIGRMLASTGVKIHHESQGDFKEIPSLTDMIHSPDLESLLSTIME